MTVFATLGMFIIDEFSFFDDEGLPTKTVAPQESLAAEYTRSCLTTSTFRSAAEGRTQL